MKLGICKFWKIQNESKLQVFLAWGKKKIIHLKKHCKLLRFQSFNTEERLE